MTLGQMLRATVQKFPDRLAITTIGKGAIAWTYRDLFDRVGRYAAVLSTKGLQRGDRICVISENCPEWPVLDWACQCLGYILVPIYPSLPKDQSEYIVRDSGAKLIVLGAADQAPKVAGLPIESLQLKGLDELAMGTQPRALDADIDTAKDEDPCTIIYTSGTTGTPKGAVMPHQAFVHVCVAAKDHIHVDQNDRFLGFLPMSHVYERVAGQCLPIYLGATICVSKGLASLATEMREFKPTVMLCVPRFLENLRHRIMDAAAKEKPLQKRLFEMFVAQGIKKARGEFAPLHGLLDPLVGKKIRERAGGELRYFVSGGAALAPAVAEFYIAVGFVILQGYGLTETSGGTFVNRPEDNRYWTVGPALDMECKIAEDGEILVRGRGNMLGYHNLPAETAAAIDPEGWFHTGDVGEFEGKNLKITDRKKDILVLANGKNVAPQKIENLLKATDHIAEAVVLGDGMEYLIALIVPNFEKIRGELGLPETELLSTNSSARALIKKDVDSVSKSLAAFEYVKKHAVIDRPFSIESGELTPSLKVKRKVVGEKYKDVIDSMR